MLNIVIAVILVFVTVILGYAATKPNTFRVQRSILVSASTDKIFPFVNDLNAWVGWSPWEKLDPNMKKTASGEPSGKGAIYEWDGNNNVGAGRMEIVESTPSSKIVIKLDFLRPFEGHNLAEFTFVPQGTKTEVTWMMYGLQPYLMRVFGIIMNCDKMVGGQFEEGLRNLKVLAEK